MYTGRHQREAALLDFDLESVRKVALECIVMGSEIEHPDLTFVGAGHFSEVWRHTPTGKVIKFGGVCTGGYDAYPLFAKACIDNFGRRFFPRVYLIEDVLSEVDCSDDKYICVMDECDTVGNDVPEGAQVRALILLIQLLLWQKEDGNDPSFARALLDTRNNRYYAHVCDLVKHGVFDEDEEDILHFVHAVPAVGDVDLHANNWMLCDGEPVIIDPISFHPSRSRRYSDGHDSCENYNEDGCASDCECTACRPESFKHLTEGDNDHAVQIPAALEEIPVCPDQCSDPVEPHAVRPCGAAEESQDVPVGHGLQQGAAPVYRSIGEGRESA